MEKITFLQFLIVCPMVFLAGFIDSIAGGGGLISLPAYMFAGLPVHLAIGTNKVSSVMGTSMATYRYAKSGYIPLKKALFAIPCALLGSSIGAKLSMRIDESSFKIIMLVILPLIAAYVLKGKALSESARPMEGAKAYALIVLISFFIGMYDGFYGPGTGSFLILLLTGIVHLSIREANGLTKVVNLCSNIAAVLVFLRGGTTLPLLGLTAGLFSIAGNYVGSRFFSKKGVQAVKPVLVIVLVIFFIKIITELTGA